jgi:hypothetical protein
VLLNLGLRQGRLARQQPLKVRQSFRDELSYAGKVRLNCAIAFIDGRFYKVISSKNYSRAYRVYKSRGKVVAKQIRQQKQLAPIDWLAYRQRAV